MIKRLAITAAVTFLLAGILATFLPSSYGATNCGTWLSPGVTRDAANELYDEAAAVADEANELDPGGEIYREAQSIANGVIIAYSQCKDSLSLRRTLTIGFLTAAVLVPAAVLFIAGRREDPEES